MGRPVICAENLLSTRQFTGHVLSANEEATGFPVENVANGRRSQDNQWRPTTANTAAWIRCVFDRPRAFNFVALDRGHNLGGKAIDLKVTNDATDFTGTFETPVDITLPSVTAPGDLDDTTGVRTEEGAWVKRFPLRVGTAVQFGIDAMGAGLLPNIVGLTIGLALELEYFVRPSEDETDVLMVEETQSTSGWTGRGQPTRPRQGTIRVQLLSAMAYDPIRYHLLGQFGDGNPMWLVFDDGQADRAIQVLRPQGSLGFPFPTDWGWRAGDVAWVEHAPKRR